MALTAQSSVASLMRKTLDRQAAVASVKLRFKQSQIENILKGYVKNGTAAPYNELIKVLKEYPLNDDNFRILLEDCMYCVVILGREFKTFVDVLCSIEWASRGEGLVHLYCLFLLSLVTAHSYHCPLVLRHLIKLFKAEDGENWEEKSPSSDLVDKWSNIHHTIAQIIAMMPMTSDLLMQILIDQFPYYKASCFANRSYVYNLIWIGKYVPSLQEQIMTAIVNRMVVMDANLVDKTKNQNQNETIFEMEVDDQDDVSKSLDYCMLEMLEWLEDEKDPMLNIMCNVFERIILPTHGIRHVQFLILYTVSVNQQCADRILNNLWVVAAGLHSLGPGALTTRRTAASHLAGLLARCIRVPNSRIVHYLRSMTDWCHSYITATQESSTSCDTKVHGAFHAICHAIFYLVAFKSQLLFSTKENLNFIESLNLTRLVTSNLNPLKSCPPQVIRAFSSVTRSYQVVYCQAIIEKNSRLSLHSTTVQGYDDWFPYDPYSLSVSGKKLWPLCIEYKDWGKANDEDQMSHLKRKREEDDDYLVHSPHKLACNLSNCISPGFKNSDSISLG